MMYRANSEFSSFNGTRINGGDEQLGPANVAKSISERQSQKYFFNNEPVILEPNFQKLIGFPNWEKLYLKSIPKYDQNFSVKYE